MGAVLICAADPHANPIPAVDNYFPICGGGFQEFSIGPAGIARAQLTWRTAGVFSVLSVQVNTADNGDLIYEVNIASADSALTVNCTASTTGLFQDLSNTASVSAGDLVCMHTSGTGGNAVRHSASVVFTATTGHVIYHGTSLSSQSFNGTNTLYYKIAGNMGAEGAEANTQIRMDVAGTAAKLQCYVISNSKTLTVTFRTRVNAGDGGQTITVLTTQTGLFEDTTGTDTLDGNDDINFAVTTLDTASFSFSFIACQFTSSATNNQVMCAVAGGSAISNSLTRYEAIGGIYGNNATPDNAGTKLRHGFAVDVTRLSVYVSAFTLTTAASATITLFKNGVDGNNVLTVTGTGLTQDTTHTDSFTATDDINIEVDTTPATVGAFTARWLSVVETLAAAAATGAIPYSRRARNYYLAR